jgi:hypothetical protein
MKPFNLKEAKAGAPVITEDGNQARIICFDRQCKYPIIALVTIEPGKENIYSFDIHGNGHASYGFGLRMKPVKKEGWVNIYPHGSIEGIFSYESYAISSAKSNLVATIRIEWEE